MRNHLFLIPYLSRDETFYHSVAVFLVAWDACHELDLSQGNPIAANKIHEYQNSSLKFYTEWRQIEQMIFLIIRLKEMIFTLKFVEVLSRSTEFIIGAKMFWEARQAPQRQETKTKELQGATVIKAGSASLGTLLLRCNSSQWSLLPDSTSLCGGGWREFVLSKSRNEKCLKEIIHIKLTFI